jgi:hypothetical protein
MKSATVKPLYNLQTLDDLRRQRLHANIQKLTADALRHSRRGDDMQAKLSLINAERLSIELAKLNQVSTASPSD